MAAKVPAPASGTLTAIHVQPDETVAVGAVLGSLLIQKIPPLYAKRAFAVFLTLVALNMLRKVVLG